MRKGYAKLAALTIIRKTPSSDCGILKAFRERTPDFWKMTTSSVYPIYQEREDEEYIE